MNQPLRIIVTGGRHAQDRDGIIVHCWLDQLLTNLCMGAIPQPGASGLFIAQGGATGIDNFVRDWCMKRGVEFVNYPYLARYGKAGGPIRNREMAINHRPSFMVAFPGGKGTRSMIRIAHELGISVIIAGLEN
jgi:hypothetical protein